MKRRRCRGTTLRYLSLLLLWYFFAVHLIFSSFFLSFWSTWQKNWPPLDEDRGEGKRFSDLEATRAQESNKFRPLKFRPLPLYEKRIRVRSE